MVLGAPRLRQRVQVMSEHPGVDAQAVPRSERAQSLTGWTPVVYPLDGVISVHRPWSTSPHPSGRLRNDGRPGRLGSRKAIGD